MNEQNRTRRPAQSQKKKRDYFLTVSFVQSFFCAMLCLLVFVCAKTNADAKESLRADFASLMQWELQSEDVQDVIALVRTYFTEYDDALPVFGAFRYDVDEAQPESDSTAATQPTAQAAAKKESKTPLLTTAGADVSETTTQKEDGAGGEDVRVLSATENTTFSPAAATAPIVRPVRGGRYSSKFGYRTNPITHEYSFHTGLDIAVPMNTKIHAAFHGVVRAVGEDARSGKYIILRHDDGLETFYCHCSEIVAGEGDRVDAGDVIARVGSTGWSTGPHLHFEVRKNGERLDPLQFLEDDA